MTAPPTTLGPSRFGSHYLGQFRGCPAAHYYAHLAPHPDDTTSAGLSTFTTASPLLVGAGVHEGLATWYRSRCTTGADNGVPDLDAAIGAVELHFAERRTEFADEDTYTADLAQATRLVRTYHDFYGPLGPRAEFPDLQIVVDNDGPVVERELVLQLAHGYVFTARLDALCCYHNRTYTFEHKTTSASGLGRLFATMAMSTQALGQHTILHDSYPHLAPEGILVNALVKNRAAKSDRPPFERQIVTFNTREDGEKFRTDALRTLSEIDEARRVYAKLVANGIAPFEAARIAYEQRGRSTGQCYNYARCPYIDLCRNPGREEPITRSFRPRPVDPTTPTTENDLA